MDLLYTELYPQFASRFEKTGLVFKSELEKSYHIVTRLQGIQHPAEVQKEVTNLLRRTLRQKEKKSFWKNLFG